MTTATETKPRAGHRAWVHQLKHQIDEFGEAGAPWCVDWTDPEGKRRRRSCGTGKKGLDAASKLADKTHAQLITGTYQVKTRKTWQQFVTEYTKKIADRMEPSTRAASLGALVIYARLMKPAAMTAIDSEKIDEFVALRLKEKSTKRSASTVSVATVNKELRHLRAVLRIAADWGYLAKSPKFRFLKQADKLPTYVAPEHFQAIYAACEAARFPKIRNVDAGDWWRALLITAFMTGWRIGQLLALRWEDVDLDAGIAFSHAEDTKGKRDERIPLHPVVVEHLKRLRGNFDSHVFPWDRRKATLWMILDEIQDAAQLADGSPLPKQGKPKRDGTDRFYKFHDLRRAFATLNAGGMDLFELQGLMQHKSLETTRRYVNMRNRLTRAVGGLFVPDVTTREAVVG